MCSRFAVHRSRFSIIRNRWAEPLTVNRKLFTNAAGAVTTRLPANKKASPVKGSLLIKGKPELSSQRRLLPHASL